MTTVITEGARDGAFIASEANGYLSRGIITVAQGQDLQPGAVLGRITLAAATAAAVAGNTGNGTVGAVTVAAGAKPGVYKVTCIEPASNAGEFIVEDPDGITVGVATVAAAFTGGGLGFTIADGGTDFAAGDAFTVTVAPGSGRYKAWDPEAADGSAIVAGVLYGRTDATSAPVKAVGILRQAEVVRGQLVWFDDATDNDKAAGIAQLAALTILAR